MDQKKTVTFILFFSVKFMVRSSRIHFTYYCTACNVKVGYRQFPEHVTRLNTTLVCLIPYFDSPSITGTTVFWIDDSFAAENVSTAIEFAVQSKRVHSTNIRARTYISGS
jgi:hypothetical protein